MATGIQRGWTKGMRDGDAAVMEREMRCNFSINFGKEFDI